MLVLPTQPRHTLHQTIGVPHLDLLDADPRLDMLADQPRRHRVGVMLHLNRAAATHAHPQSLLRLQPGRRQRTQLRQLRRQRCLPTRVPPHQQVRHELLVL
jgi:hypothetical protein